MEQATNLKKVMEVRIFASRVEFTLRGILSIEKTEFHEFIIDLMKRKRQSTEQEGVRPMNVNAMSIDGFKADKDLW